MAASKDYKLVDQIIWKPGTLMPVEKAFTMLEVDLLHLMSRDVTHVKLLIDYEVGVPTVKVEGYVRNK